MITTLINANIYGSEPFSAFQPGTATPFTEAGNVVTNGCVGGGAPEIDTVGTEGVVVGVPLEVLHIENFADDPNMFPEVEFEKIMQSSSPAGRPWPPKPLELSKVLVVRSFATRVYRYAAHRLLRRRSSRPG